ncbi:MAG: radical SAM protein, partial [Patescibacteria group bacterium]|nr:radical SAM protein [Patescibacteria group bacterium]
MPQLSNDSVFRQMQADPYYRQFSLELTDLLKRDPGYSPKRQAKILESCARGERIVQFDGSYIVNSSVPAVPSRAFMTFIQGGRNENRLLTDLAYARRSAPLSTHLCITTRCNDGCKHGNAPIPDRQADLTRGQWLQIIGDLQDAGVAYIAFSGGEPLLRPDMEDIVAAVDDRSTTLLFTDGRGLSRRRAEALKRAGLFSLAVSIDSSDDEEDNRLRHNPCAIDDALRAIDCASEAGLYTMASAVV